jgi:hypothetical protein
LPYAKTVLNLKSLESCGLTDEKKTEAQQALKILDANGNQQNVNEAGIVTEITRPSVVGANPEWA